MKIIIMKKHLKTVFKKASILFLFLLVFIGQYTLAQTNPLGASYFQQLYLNNPAMAGNEKGLVLGMSLRKQLNGIAGSPINQIATAEYGFKNNVSAGINVYNDKAGIFRTTRVVATYAYFIKVGHDQQLHFGLSGGFLNRNLANTDINGDQDDADLIEFAKRGAYVDGDFGMAYTSNKLTAQVAFPQLKNLIKKDERLALNSYPSFFTSLSYKIKTGFDEEDLELEPKVCYRGMRGLSNILDIGTNVAFANRRLNLFAMYHSSQNCTFGLGVKYKSLSVGGAYATGTSAIRNYTNGDFELNLKLGLF
jgi:type IX secretion system PorP/SprF family membrane protein